MGPDHGNVVIAHHQVHTIFQGLPRQVPPDHMCHPWPRSRVGSRAQNFAFKSQISLLNKSLQTLWSFFYRCGRLWGMRSAVFFFGGKLRSCDPESIAKKNADFSFFVFQRNSTTQIVYLTSAEKKSAELSIQTYGSTELIFWFCVVDFC